MKAYDKLQKDTKEIFHIDKKGTALLWQETNNVRMTVKRFKDQYELVDEGREIRCPNTN